MNLEHYFLQRGGMLLAEGRRQKGRIPSIKSFYRDT
jgi:hypothetical protein